MLFIYMKQLTGVYIKNCISWFCPRTTANVKLKIFVNSQLVPGCCKTFVTNFLLW